MYRNTLKLSTAEPLIALTPPLEPTDINPSLSTARLHRSDFSNVYGISFRKRKKKKTKNKSPPTSSVKQSPASIQENIIPNPRNPWIRPPDGVFFGHPSRTAHESPLMFLLSSRLLFAFLPSILFFTLHPLLTSLRIRISGTDVHIRLYFLVLSHTT